MDRPASVSLDAGAGDDQRVIRLTLVTFRKMGANIQADLGMIKSRPKGKWCAAVLLSDRLGRVRKVRPAFGPRSGTHH